MDDENKELPKKHRKLKLVSKFENDDYSRYSADDYVERNFEIGQDVDHGNVIYPKDQLWNSGIEGSVSKDKNFYGVGPKNYTRNDDRIYEDACELLMRHRDIDASEIVVNVKKGTVTLTGKVESRQMKKNAELVLFDLSGVKEIINELVVIPKGNNHHGPISVSKKDLGLS